VGGRVKPSFFREARDCARGVTEALWTQPGKGSRPRSGGVVLRRISDTQGKERRVRALGGTANETTEGKEKKLASENTEQSRRLLRKKERREMTVPTWGKFGEPTPGGGGGGGGANAKNKIARIQGTASLVNSQSQP